MLRPFIYLTSYSVMFFLTEFALHTHLNAFGARTMTALYAAAMFINGCGYLLFPLLARTRTAAADKNRFVDTPENRKDVEDFYRRPFRVSFSLPGSIVINALSKEEAKKAVEAAINGNGSAIAEDISLVLQDHLQHRDVSVDDVEEEE